MQLSDYVRIVRRRVWLILLAVAFGVGGAVAATSQQTEIYRSEVQLIVSVTTGDDDGQLARRSVAVQQAVALAEIAQTPPAVQAARAAAGADSGVVNVESSADNASPFVRIAVSGTDAVTVARVADAFADTLPKVFEDLNQADPGSRTTLEALAPAPVNTLPVSPRPKRNALVGLALGLLLGLAAAFARESLDRRLVDSADVETATNLPVLGVIPIELGKHPLPAATHPHSLRAEAYRLVRTNLQFTDATALPPCLLVTSPAAGDGKTSVATNLAVSCALAGEGVVIVDADLRRPQVASRFGVDSRPGLSDVLAGQAHVAQSLRPALEGLLAVLPAGTLPPNPSELLGSPAMQVLLTQLLSQYDRVIVDGPPVLPVADSVKLASFVSGVIVVAYMGSTTRDGLGRTQASLQRASARILGVVANGANPSRDAAYGYGQYASSRADEPVIKGRRRRQP